MNKERKREITRYQLKAVVFDIQAECKKLKKALSEAGMCVIVPFFGLQVERTLQEMLEGTDLVPEECLILTNCEQHAKLAERMNMAVAGCMEGHFEVPKQVPLLEEPEEVSVDYLNQVYCHAQKIPATIAETERCFICELTGEDTDALYEMLQDEEVARYLPAKAGTREEEINKLLSYVAHVYSFFGYGYWGIFNKSNGELIGRAGFQEGIYPLKAGYVIKRSEWGKGLATEVLNGLVQYAEEELDCTEIHADIDERNTASLRVAEKCGLICNRLRN
ncbi:MAG: GNAT family N-acetyltransferase [Lachnospiraceae bacterium]|nr:GNAT family N-acetyltransferase [Lachnospiraceae bacterium]